MKIEVRPFKANMLKKVDGKDYIIPFQFWNSADELKIIEEWDKRVLVDTLKEAKEVIEHIRSAK